MTELRLQYKADRLGSQHTKQSIRTHSPSGLKSKPPLARERFSPLTPTGRSRIAAIRQTDDACRARTLVGQVHLVQERRVAGVAELISTDQAGVYLICLYGISPE